MIKINPISSIILIISAFICSEFFKESGQQKMIEYSFLNKYRFKSIPLADSTNFDNFEYKEKLSKDQMKLLKLNEICSPNSTEFITASVNYKLKLSDKYNTVIITYSPSEVILITVLANYDSSYNLIDFKQIAFDEIFDNWSRTISEIKRDKLYVTNIDYSTAKPIKKYKTYIFDENGKINASH